MSLEATKTIELRGQHEQFPQLKVKLPRSFPNHISGFDPEQPKKDPKLDRKRIPMPFAASDHIIALDDMPGLIAALAFKGASAHLRRDPCGHAGRTRTNPPPNCPLRHPLTRI